MQWEETPDHVLEAEPPLPESPIRTIADYRCACGVVIPADENECIECEQERVPVRGVTAVCGYCGAGDCTARDDEPCNGTCPSCEGEGTYEVQVGIATFKTAPCPDCQEPEDGPDFDPPERMDWPGPYEGFDRNYP